MHTQKALFTANGFDLLTSIVLILYLNLLLVEGKVPHEVAYLIAKIKN
jgi:hypothetical protein